METPLPPALPMGKIKDNTINMNIHFECPSWLSLLNFKLLISA